jgi:hypothetical protein
VTDEAKQKMRESLSPRMREALALVPKFWARPPHDFRLGREFVRHPLFQRTFRALESRGLLVWRGGPGTWEWRQQP